MEVIAVAASIAGLVTLAGQCVSGMRELQGLYQDIASASKNVEALMRDIESLLRSLHDVQRLLEKINADLKESIDEINTLSLKIQLEDCQSSLMVWISSARSLQPVHGKGGKALFHRFSTALNKKSVHNIRKEMQQRRLEIVVVLTTLGRVFDAKMAMQTHHIEKEVQESKNINSAVLGRAALVQEALDRLEVRSESLAVMSERSMRSLASVASAMSCSSGRFSGHAHNPRYSLLGIRPCAYHDTVPSVKEDDEARLSWSCAAIDDWKMTLQTPQDDEHEKRPSLCGFCGQSFPESPQWNACLYHLESKHKLGQCNIWESFHLEGHFKLHLEHSHNADLGPWSRNLLLVARNGGYPKRAARLHRHQLTHIGYPASTQVLKRSGSFDSNSSNASKRLRTGRKLSREAPQADDATLAPTSPELQTGMLMMSAWDASLLGEWTGTNDRINRWLLHILGAEPSLASFHQKMLEQECQSREDMEGDAFTGRRWSRLVFKYWFLDEAATGFKVIAGPKSAVSTIKQNINNTTS